MAHYDLNLTPTTTVPFKIKITIHVYGNVLFMSILFGPAFTSVKLYRNGTASHISTCEQSLLINTTRNTTSGIHLN